MIPDYTTVELGTVAPVGDNPVAAEPWVTPEGIDVKAVYTPADVDGLAFLLSLIHISEPTRPY